MIDRDVLSRFLHDLGKTKEPGLIISDTVSEISEFLIAEGYKQANNPRDMGTLEKVFVVPNESNKKAWYDIASQFLSGYIEYVENGEDKMLRVDPEAKTFIIILDTNASLKEPSFKRACGLTIVT